jgi:AraC-like DNA-binding protein/mannose-6-phosphate isomerase-like protein (cupin superfamily)
MEHVVQVKLAPLRTSVRLPQHGVLIESRLQRPGLSPRLHSHRFNSLMYIVAGHGRCRIGSAAWPIGPDGAVLLPGGQVHQLDDAPGRPMAVFVVYFSDAVAATDGAMVRELLSRSEPLAVPRHYAQQIRRMLRRMLYEQDSRPPYYQSAMRHGLCYILMELYRVSRELPRQQGQPLQKDSIARVKETLDYISRRYFEQQSIAAAARTAHISQRQFANLCRRLTGQSFVNFVNGARCTRAKQLLLQTEMPVSAIAFEVGFEELSTFYRAFHKHWGASPLTIRGG